jgi:hypothetical protein
MHLALQHSARLHDVILCDGHLLGEERSVQDPAQNGNELVVALAGHKCEGILGVKIRENGQVATLGVGNAR